MNVNQIEELMRPGKLSESGFLGQNENLVEVLAEDEATVKKLGVTNEQIAARMEYFIQAVQCRPMVIGKIVDNNFKVTGDVCRGIQHCPWGDRAEYSNLDLVVTNLRLKESLFFPGLIVHLIRKHHFYEGKKSPYRVDPKLAVRVLEII